jgi:hypothetical protein
MRAPQVVRLQGLAVGFWAAVVCVCAQTITTTPTFHNAGIKVEFTTPPPQATIRLFVRRADTTNDYREVHPLSRVSATVFAGSVFMLEPGTSYALKLTSSAFSADQFVAFTTRSDVFPDATNTIYHVSPISGSDNNDGRSVAQAFRTLGKALSQVQAGAKVLLQGGTYYEGELEMLRSGSPAAPIVIENAPGATPVLDGTDTNFAPVWALDDAANHVYRTPCASTPENAYLSGVQFFHYLSLDDLRNHRWNQPSGYFVDGSFLYARFPNDSAPGTNRVTIPAHTTGITLDQKSHIQIRGLEFCYYGQGTYHRGLYIDGGDSNLIDHCFFHHNGTGVALKRAADFNTIQHCTFTESPITDWSWAAVKEGGVGYEAGGVVVYGSSQPNRGNVVRYCTFTNMFDGAHLYSEDPAGPTENLDFHNNHVRGCGDDGIETDGAGSNCRIYFNQFHDFLTGVSVAPCALGPTYVFRNLLTDWGPREGFEGYPFKFNVSSSLRIEWVYLYHNTCVTETPGQDGFLFKQYSNWTNIVSRNNIFAGTRYALESWSNVNPVDFDFDDLLTAQAPPVISWVGSRYGSVALFAAATGHETHGLAFPPRFVNPAAQDYYLHADSPLIDRAVLIPGVSDDYVGAGPDVGAFEFGMQAKAISAQAGVVESGWVVGAPGTYQLQSTVSLFPPDWSAVGEPIQAERPFLRLLDGSMTEPHRFYRLQRVPP